jgi:hypothetical protein
MRLLSLLESTVAYKTTPVHQKNAFIKMLLNAGTITTQRLCSGGAFRTIIKGPATCITRKHRRRRSTMRSSFRLLMTKKSRLKHMYNSIRNKPNYEHNGMQKERRNQANGPFRRRTGRTINKREMGSIKEELIISDIPTNALFHSLFLSITKLIARSTSQTNSSAIFNDSNFSKMAPHPMPLNGRLESLLKKVFRHLSILEIALI